MMYLFGCIIVFVFLLLIFKQFSKKLNIRDYFITFVLSLLSWVLVIPVLGFYLIIKNNKHEH